MTFPPPLHGESRPPASGPPPAPLAVDERIADRYQVERVLSATPARTLYRAVDPDGEAVFVLEMSAPLHLDPAFDPDATLSASENAICLPAREHGTHEARAFVAFNRPHGTPACTGLQIPWDPDRLLLLGRLLASLRRARDHRVYIPHCGWDTLFVDPDLKPLWISPAIAGAQVRVEERGMAPSAAPIPRDPTLEDTATLPDAHPFSPTVHLEEYYMARLRELLPSLVLHNFAAAPVEEAGAPTDLLPEELPWMPGLIATAELRQLLSELIGGRIDSLDAAQAAVDDFGANRVVRLQNGWRTHRGRVRELNEDALLVVEESSVLRSRPGRTVLYAVADGMGGHEAGEIASEITLKALAGEIIRRLNLTSAREHGRQITDHEFLMSTAGDAIDRTNEILRAYAQEAHGESRRRPGSTLVFAISRGPIATIAHVGDSRAYKIGRDGSLERITHDHSPVQRLVDLCRLTPDEAFYHPNRHQIYSNIGIAPEHLARSVEPRYLKEGEGLLLCTDGLSDMLRDAEIEEICRGHNRDPRQLSQLLVEAACEAGGVDNITVIVVFRSPVPFQEERETPPNPVDEVEEADA